jgi:hypothetical protein
VCVGCEEVNENGHYSTIAALAIGEFIMQSVMVMVSVVSSLSLSLSLTTR